MTLTESLMTQSDSDAKTTTVESAEKGGHPRSPQAAPFNFLIGATPISIVT